ncbi:MAG: Hsp70 family protein, partial [Planctomycetota bacterium]|jgi:molecular chaperone DnaK (HSP70)
MDPLLPQDAPEEVTKISPLEATTRILRYVRRVWDRGFARKDKSLVLAQQDVYLTVPASFDATARMLTLRAADDAGFETVTLLEEPLAAFYAWLAGTGGAWRDRLEVGDAVLVCDVGGGTTDFTIVSARERDGALQLERTAVGHHILLGGDNLDLALARLLQQKLRKEQKVKLDRRRLLGLVHACRGAKEAILAAEGGLDSAGITVQGTGRKLVGGSVTVDLTRADVERVVLEGFLPACELDTEPERADGYGLGEIGLPFERDPRITAHLATFLRGARVDKITHLLFNGGTTRPAAVRQRLADAVQGWFPGAKLSVLDGADLDFAVARGAAFYGLQRSGRGVRVRADIARSYYVGVESPMPAVPGLDPPIKALCLVPRGLEEGTEVTLPGERFQLRIGKPARFRFLTATTRSEDKPGTVLEDWEWEDELQEISPLAVTLPAEADTDNVQVTLHARVTEVGVLELYCREVGGDRTWQLSYNVREAEPEPTGESSTSSASDEETAG